MSRLMHINRNTRDWTQMESSERTFSDLILKRALRRRGSNLKAPVITDTVIQKDQMNKNRLVHQ